MTTLQSAATLEHPVVSREEWLKARIALLQKEKELTRLKDKLNAERLDLPWVRLEKDYFFETSEGRRSLASLFAGRSQLIVQHFMLGPGWEEGCVGCSFSSDHLDGALPHLENHDVSVVVVARAPLAEIEAYKKRMGWKFPFVSSFGSDFNFDYQVSFTPGQMALGRGLYNFEMDDLSVEELSGHSAFFKDESGQIFHTYSAYARGDESMLATYAYLDIAPKGRNETGPRQNLSDWVRHHDRYGKGGRVNPDTGRYESGREGCDCQKVS